MSCSDWHTRKANSTLAPRDGAKGEPRRGEIWEAKEREYIYYIVHMANEAEKGGTGDAGRRIGQLKRAMGGPNPERQPGLAVNRHCAEKIESPAHLPSVHLYPLLTSRNHIFFEFQALRGCFQFLRCGPRLTRARTGCDRSRSVSRWTYHVQIMRIRPICYYDGQRLPSVLPWLRLPEE